MVVSQLCSSATEVKNPCKKIQRLPKNITGYILAKSNQSFSSIDAVTNASIREEIKNKNLTISYELNGDLEQNIENGITQTSTRDYKGSVSQRRATAKHKLNSYQQAVVSSYEGNYSKVYFYTEDDELICEISDDGKVKGLPLASLLVGEHPLPSGDTSSDVFFQFKKYESSVLVPSIDFNEMQGIYNLELEIVSANASEIKFTAKACCGNLTTLESADLKFTASDGTAQALTITYANGVYTGSGTSLVTGVLESVGVIDKTEFLLEGGVNVTI